jgi:hypothetical protein
VIYTVGVVKRVLFILFVFFGVVISTEVKSWDELWWAYRWQIQLFELIEDGSLHYEYGIFPYKPFEMPVMKEHPRAAAQLDSVIADSMKWQKSLEWALDSLKPGYGPAAGLSDKLRKEMIYYLYNNRLISLKKPLRFDSYYPNWYFHGGAGTSEAGWIRYFGVIGEEPLLEGLFTIFWAPTDNNVMQASRALQMFNDAKQEGVFANRAIDPKWDNVSSVAPCTLFNRSAIRIKIPLEYGDIFWDCRVPDTLLVFSLAKGDYEYLVSFTTLPSPICSDYKEPSFYEDWIEQILVLEP